MNDLSPENLFIVLSWDKPPALVAAHEGRAGAVQLEQVYPKARLVMDYPTLQEALRVAQEAEVFEARPFGFKPTLHFCLTAQRGEDRAAIVVKATSTKKALRKAKQVAYGGSDITLMGTREELAHYVEQLDEALEQGKPIHLEQDLRGGMPVMDGMGTLPGELRELVDGMIEFGKPAVQGQGQGMSSEEVLAFLQSVPATSGMSEPIELLESLDEAVEWLEEKTNTDDQEGATPLHLVADYEWLPYTAAQVAKRLLELGADPNARNHSGSTPLQGLAESIYCQGREVDGVEEDERALVKVLLDGGADPLMGRPRTPEEKTVMPVEVFPDLVEPWIRAAALDATLPTPLATRARERF